MGGRIVTSQLPSVLRLFALEHCDGYETTRVKPVNIVLISDPSCSASIVDNRVGAGSAGWHQWTSSALHAPHAPAVQQERIALVIPAAGHFVLWCEVSPEQSDIPTPACCWP